MFFMARYLTQEELGIYGLFTATLSIALYFLGMDFYVFNTREILKREEADRTGLIRDQLVFHGIGFLVILPLLLGVFYLKILPWKYAPYFYLILICEHLSQESHRLLVTLSKAAIANLVLFFRGGIWVYFILGIGLSLKEAQNLKLIWLGWMGGVLASLGLSAYILKSLDWESASKKPVDWRWIFKGVQTSLSFFTSTLAILGIQFLDRYLIEHYHGKGMVGTYTFYTSIANVIQVFVFTGIIAPLYPQIVAAYQSHHLEKYQRLMSKMSLAILASVFLLAVTSVLCIYPVIDLIQKPFYLQHLPTYWLLLAATGLASFAEIPHYALYVRQKDRKILWSTLSTFILSLLLNLLLIPRYDILGAAIANAGAMLFFLLFKTFFLMRVGK